MKEVILILLFSSIFSLFAQSQFPKQQLQVAAGRSLHGTGDMRGLIFTTAYSKYVRKRVSWGVELTGTIHDNSLPIFFNDRDGNLIDGSIRYTTAGVQTTGYLGYSFIKTKRHEVQFKVGGLLRYQSSSYYDQVQVLYPALTGYPVPVNVFINKTPQRTYSFGGISQLQYSYTFANNISLGLVAGLQTDTNGDTLTQTTFAIGKRF